jgi:hypothetical protein
VLTLFKTLLEIIFLQKGPEHIPRSSVLLVILLGCWLAVGVIGAMVVDTYDSESLMMDLILTVVGFGIYAAALKIFEKSERLLQALAAILGCGAIFGTALFAGRYILTTVLAVSETALFSEFILLWSILIEGHIIARTIERPWIIGILFALAVFITQLQVFAVIKPLLDPAI